MRCFYGSDHPQSFVTILHQMCDAEFQNLTRSTIPSLHYWREPDATLAQVLAGMALPLGSDGTLCFEFPVPSLGRNKPSFSDLAYIGADYAVVIEAKSTEPVGETVEEWLRSKRNSPNARQVLQRWLALIQLVTGEADAGAVQRIPYQMIHRLASLCSLESPRRVLLYQLHRVSAVSSDFSAPLNQLAKAIHAAGQIEIWLHHIESRKTARYSEVEQSLPGKGTNERAFLVRSAILERNLFEVESERFEKIC